MTDMTIRANLSETDSTEEETTEMNASFREPTEGFPRTIQMLGSLMDEFRVEAEKNPRIILRELTDDPRDDNIREGIMALAQVTTDPRIKAWYTALLEMAALRYAKQRVRDIEAETLQPEKTRGI